jgi:mono/diheme cytochrome c family protein
VINTLASKLVLSATLVLIVAVCGSEAGDPPDSASDSPADEITEAGGIPVSAPEGPIDTELAASGENLFNVKGCVACHTIGKGRLTGPDLQGVTERRTFEWMYRMISNPDSMTRNDPIGMELMAEFMTPMPSLDIQPDEVRALFEFLRAGSAD